MDWQLHTEQCSLNIVENPTAQGTICFARNGACIGCTVAINCYSKQRNLVFAAQFEFTIFYKIIAMPQIVIALGQLLCSTRLKTINLCFMYNFDIKISVSCHTYFYLKFITVAVNQ